MHQVSSNLTTHIYFFQTENMNLKNDNFSEINVHLKNFHCQLFH